MPILRELARLGSGADCSSRHEIDMAMLAGIPINQLVYNTPAPDIPLVLDLLRSGATVVVDSVEMLDTLAASSLESDIPGNLLVRVNPEVPVEYEHLEDWQEMTAHASSGSKFGIPSEDLVPLLSRLELPVTGLHIHVGTQMDNVDSFINALNLMHRLADRIERETNHSVRIIDLGGGLGIDFFSDQKFPTVHEYTEALRNLRWPGVTYWIEPGHALVGNTMATLTSVVAKKHLRGRHWAILDVGTDQFVKITLLKWYHQILDQHHQKLASTGLDAIGGPLCFAGDVLLPETDLSGVNAGDPLLIQHTGAYCNSVANRFNGRLSPAWITARDDGSHKLTNLPEDEFIDPHLLTFDWRSDRLRSYSDRQMDNGRITELSSEYLRIGANEDRYRFIETRQTDERTFEFLLDAESPLGLVSLPFAVRMAADATIVAALALLGKKQKDVSVWGSRLYMCSDKMIKTNKPIRCLVTTSPTGSLKEAGHQQGFACFDLADGRFKGSFRLTI